MPRMLPVAVVQLLILTASGEQLMTPDQTVVVEQLVSQGAGKRNDRRKVEDPAAIDTERHSNANGEATISHFATIARSRLTGPATPSANRTTPFFNVH